MLGELIVYEWQIFHFQDSLLLGFLARILSFLTRIRGFLTQIISLDIGDTDFTIVPSLYSFRVEAVGEQGERAVLKPQRPFISTYL